MKIKRRDFNKMIGAAPALRLFESLPGFASDAKGERPRGEVRADTQDPLSWLRTNHRWTTFNAHFQSWDPRIASHLNADEIMRNVLRSNANVFMIFAVDGLGYAYYPSKVAPIHPNLQDKNLLQTIVQECNKHKIAVIFYYSVSSNKHAGRSHPDWPMRDNHNRVPGYDDSLGPILCYNSGYIDYVKAITQELLEYNPNGVFYDMLWFGTSGTVCYDEKYCQPLFRKKYGIEMPLKPSWDDAWRKFLEFRYESNLAFSRKLNAMIHKARPDVSVSYNYHGQPPFSWQVGMKPVQHSLISDYSTGESLPFLLGHWYPSLLATYIRGLRTETPFMMATTKCIRVYTDYTIRPETDIKWEVFTYLSHGGHAFVIDDALYDGSLQPQFYEMLGRIFGDVERKEPYFGQPHVRDVGLYYSLKSRDWYGRDDAKRYENAFIGAHRALAELHIPVDALFDETITLEKLKQYPVVFLANTAILSNAEVEILREFVRSGGRLLATHDTGLYDENGNLLRESVLADLLGIHYNGKADFSTHYCRLSQGLLNADMIPNWDILVPGSANVIEATAGKPFGELNKAFFDGPPFHPIGIGAHNSSWETVGPAVILNEYGKGATAYLPFGIASAYVGDYPSPQHRLLLRNVIRYLYPSPEVRITAPPTVEAIATKDPGKHRYIVHFIGYQAGRVIGGMWAPVIPNLTEEPLIYRAHIQLDRPIREVVGLSKKTQINQEGASVSLQIEDIHETVIIDMGDQAREG